MAEGGGSGNDVYVHKFNLTAGGKWLIKESGLSLVTGRRYGLVGPNGCGKSTLMNALAHRDEELAKGIPAHVDILLVEQEVAASDTTALDMVLSADQKRLDLLKQQADLEERQLKEGLSTEEQADIGDQLREVYDELEAIGASSAEQRASAILSGLQFREEQKSWPTRNFSGGWRMRLSLARALFRKPRLLLLDEPTNHLDLHAVIWLEGYLQRWKQILVVVSHDRNFLSQVTTDVLHIFQRKLVHYVGNYDVFEKVFEAKIEEYKKDYEKQQKRLKALKKAGKITTDLSKTDRNESKAKKKDREKLLKEAGGKAHDLLKEGGDEEDGDDLLQPLRDNNMRIIFNAGGECAHPLISVSEVTFGYSPEKILFTDVNFGISVESRIALVGANGTGKSSLLKLITEDVSPIEGSVNTARSVRVGVYSQHSAEKLHEDKTPVTYLQWRFPELSYQEIRNNLGKFGLEGHHHEQSIATLSGGQKSRVVFVELGLQKTHVLLLDEPTNHLDLETVDALIDGLRAYEGGVMVITHNVQLISEVCEEIWILDGGKVNVWQSDFLEYRDYLEEQLREYQEEQEAQAALPKAQRQGKEAEGGASAGAGGPKSKEERQRERERLKEHQRLKAEQKAREVEAAAQAERERQEEQQRLAQEEAEAEARRAREAAEEEERVAEAAAKERRAKARAAAGLEETADVDVDAGVAQLVAMGSEESQAVTVGLEQLCQCATDALGGEATAWAHLLHAFTRAVLQGADPGGGVVAVRAWSLPLGLLRHRTQTRGQGASTQAADDAVCRAVELVSMRMAEDLGTALRLAAAKGDGGGQSMSGPAADGAALAPVCCELLDLELWSGTHLNDWISSLEARARPTSGAAGVGGSVARKLEAARCALVVECLAPVQRWLQEELKKEAAAAAAEDDDSDSD